MTRPQADSLEARLSPEEARAIIKAIEDIEREEAAAMDRRRAGEAESHEPERWTD